MIGGINIKPSKFNVYLSTPDGTELAFNSLSCGLAVVDETYQKLLDRLPNIDYLSLGKQERETYDAAVSGKFIIPDDFDELLDFSVKRNLQKYSIDSLGLTIAPTLSCNFKCVYCYETSKPGRMSDETQANIVRFIETQTEHLKNLDVTWYGGEPLLAMDTIEKLSKQFIDICEEHGISYKAFMITNGYLITDTILEQMVKNKIDGVQITIDGPKRIHDTRRINKDGKSSFDTILANVEKLLMDGIKVVLRINVDKTNEEYLNELMKNLTDKLSSKKVEITFGQVTAYTDACRSIEGTCYNNSEFASKLAKYYKLLQDHGFGETNPFPYPSTKFNYCCAELINSFVIDHEGNLYKCWNVVGDEKYSVGNINDKTLDVASYQNGKWITLDPTVNPQCRECKLLPLCVGGCPYSAIVQGEEMSCDLVKYNLSDVMLTYYNYAKEGLI